MIEFQYNKTSLQLLDKNLKMRVRALPTIKNKENALRIEVKKTKKDAAELESLLEEKIKEFDFAISLFGEFDPSLLTVGNVIIETKKIAGTKIPILKDIEYEIKEFSLFNNPKWWLDGISQVKEIAKIGIKREVALEKLAVLEHTRKKTTQKVNLFEKVQIPGYEDAIKKIKRFMEDEDNLSKSAQKIVKMKQEREKNALINE
jgi:V/A-type H+-transporting ATPase subunit D